MPRTAVFFDRLDKAFDEPNCLIDFEPLEDVRGGLIKVGESTKPYGCDALLKWYDLNPTLPHSRATFSLSDMHPVMTPNTRMEDYASAVRSLSERGWDNAEEVEEDTARRGHKRGHDDVWDVAPIDAMRQGLRYSSWHLITHTKDKREALRFIDLRFMDKGWMADNTLSFLVSMFLEHRARMWRFPPGTKPQPVYLNLQELAQALAVICERFSAISIEDKIRAIVEEKGKYRIATTTVEGGSEALVLNAPDAVDWIRGVLLPEEDPDGLAWLRMPHTEGDVLECLCTQPDEAVHLNYNDEELCEAMPLCFTETLVYEYRRPHTVNLREGSNDAERWLLLEDATPRTFNTANAHAKDIKRDDAACPFSESALRHAIRSRYESRRTLMYVLLTDNELHVRADPMLLPSDPYTNPDLLGVLQYNLGRMDAEERVERGPPTDPSSSYLRRFSRAWSSLRGFA